MKTLSAAKAWKEYELIFAETEESEAAAIEDQKLLGASCRDLRIACFVPRNAIAQELKTDSMRVAAIERRATTFQAEQYKTAVLRLADNDCGIKFSHPIS